MGALEMSKSAFSFALAAGFYVAAAGDLAGQACQGCTCAGSMEVHPTLTLSDCL